MKLFSAFSIYYLSPRNSKQPAAGDRECGLVTECRQQYYWIGLVTTPVMTTEIVNVCWLRIAINQRTQTTVGQLSNLTHWRYEDLSENQS